MERLKELLTKHDFYFESDGGHAAYIVGTQERAEIIKEAKANGLSHQDMVYMIEGMSVTGEVVTQWQKLDWEKA